MWKKTITAVLFSVVVAFVYMILGPSQVHICTEHVSGASSTNSSAVGCEATEGNHSVFSLDFEIPIGKSVETIVVREEISSDEILRIDFSSSPTGQSAGTISLMNSQFGSPINFSFGYDNSKATQVKLQIDDRRWSRVYINKELVNGYRWHAPIFPTTHVTKLIYRLYPEVTPLSIRAQTSLFSVNNHLASQTIALLLLFITLLVVWNRLQISEHRNAVWNMSKNTQNIATVALIISTCSVIFYYSGRYGPEIYFDRNGIGYASVARYSDWYQLLNISRMKEPYLIAHAQYPPAFLGMFKILSAMGPIGSLGVIAAFCCITTASVVSWALSGTLLKRVILSITMVGFSYPFLFALDRGASDLIMAVLMSVFVYLMATSRVGSAAAILGIMVAFKLFPIFLLPLLLLKGSKIRNIGVSIFTSVMSTISGSIVISGSLILIPQFIKELLSQTSAVAQYSARSTSIIPWAYSLISIRLPSETGPQLSRSSELLAYALILAVVVTVGNAVFTQSLKTSESMMLLMIVTLLISPVSNDYRLLPFIPVVGYWLFEKGDMKLPRYAIIMLGCLFSVRPVMWLTNSPQTLGSLLTMPILLAMIAVVLRCRSKPMLN